jgi:transposase
MRVPIFQLRRFIVLCFPCDPSDAPTSATLSDDARRVDRGCADASADGCAARMRLKFPLGNITRSRLRCHRHPGVGIAVYVSTPALRRAGVSDQAALAWAGA